MEESYQFSAPLTGFKTFFSDSCFYFYLKQSFSMDLISVSLGRPLSVTESRSSISIWAPLKVFNIHLSEVSPFHLSMCSEIPPTLDFSFENFVLCTSLLK